VTFRKVSIFAISAAVLSSLVYAQRATEEPSWAPKPAPSKYVPPHKPHTKLPDLKDKHKGHANWTETIVSDNLFHADYIQSAPGSKVSKRFHSDTREWWVIMAGKIRFDIEGQDSFVATKGSMVQVPYQTIYSMETIGDEPSLRFEVNIAGAHTLYPGSEKPPAISGTSFIPVTLRRKPAPYGGDERHVNKPHINLYELAKASPKYSGGRFVHDDRGVANIIYGYEKNGPSYNPKNRGHYHPESAEFWLIMAGQIQYPIEGQPMVIASEGDVVYAPPFTFHAPRFYGEGPSCRLAMNGYTNIAHLFEADEPH
jgi:mannose-6-phosphate isomerase-like protein (cupin superfamily)